MAGEGVPRLSTRHVTLSHFILWLIVTYRPFHARECCILCRPGDARTANANDVRDRAYRCKTSARALAHERGHRLVRVAVRTQQRTALAYLLVVRSGNARLL